MAALHDLVGGAAQQARKNKTLIKDENSLFERSLAVGLGQGKAAFQQLTGDQSGADQTLGDLEGTGSDIQSIRDINNVSEAAEFTTSLIGQSLGAFAPVVAGTALGAAAAPAAGISAAAGGLAGAATTALPLNTGFNLREQVDAGVAQEDLSLGRAALTAVPQTALDLAGPLRALKTINTVAKAERVISPLAKTKLGRVGIAGKELGSQAALEGAAEGTQGVLAAAQTQGLKGAEDLEVEDYLDRFIEEGAAGAIAGSVLATPGAVGKSVQARAPGEEVAPVANPKTPRLKPVIDKLFRKEVGEDGVVQPQQPQQTQQQPQQTQQRPQQTQQQPQQTQQGVIDLARESDGVVSFSNPTDPTSSPESAQLRRTLEGAGGEQVDRFINQRKVNPDAELVIDLAGREVIDPVEISETLRPALDSGAKFKIPQQVLETPAAAQVQEVLTRDFGYSLDPERPGLFAPSVKAAQSQKGLELGNRLAKTKRKGVKTAKSLARAKLANKFIGEGALNGQIESFRRLAGNLGNVEKYTQDDKVFVGVDASTKAPTPVVDPQGEFVGKYRLVENAIDAGATLIVNPKVDRDKPANVAERHLAKAIVDRGYVEDSPGLFKPPSSGPLPSLTQASQDIVNQLDVDEPAGTQAFINANPRVKAEVENYLLQRKEQLEVPVGAVGGVTEPTLEVPVVESSNLEAPAESVQGKLEAGLGPSNQPLRDEVSTWLKGLSSTEIESLTSLTVTTGKRSDVAFVGLQNDTLQELGVNVDDRLKSSAPFKDLLEKDRVRTTEAVADIITPPIMQSEFTEAANLYREIADKPPEKVRRLLLSDPARVPLAGRLLTDIKRRPNPARDNWLTWPGFREDLPPPVLSKSQTKVIDKATNKQHGVVLPNGLRLDPKALSKLATDQSSAIPAPERGAVQGLIGLYQAWINAEVEPVAPLRQALRPETVLYDRRSGAPVVYGELQGVGSFAYLQGLQRYYSTQKGSVSKLNAQDLKIFDLLNQTPVKTYEALSEAYSAVLKDPLLAPHPTDANPVTILHNKASNILRGAGDTHQGVDLDSWNRYAEGRGTPPHLQAKFLNLLDAEIAKATDTKQLLGRLGRYAVKQGWVDQANYTRDVQRWNAAKAGTLERHPAVLLLSEFLKPRLSSIQRAELHADMELYYENASLQETNPAVQSLEAADRRRWQAYTRLADTLGDLQQQLHPVKFKEPIETALYGVDPAPPSRGSVSTLINPKNGNPVFQELGRAEAILEETHIVHATEVILGQAALKERLDVSKEKLNSKVQNWLSLKGVRTNGKPVEALKGLDPTRLDRIGEELLSQVRNMEEADKRSAPTKKLVGFSEAVQQAYRQGEPIPEDAKQAVLKKIPPNPKEVLLVGPALTIESKARRLRRRGHEVTTIKATDSKVDERIRSEVARNPETQVFVEGDKQRQLNPIQRVGLKVVPGEIGVNSEVLAGINILLDLDGVTPAMRKQFGVGEARTDSLILAVYEDVLSGARGIKAAIENLTSDQSNEAKRALKSLNRITKQPPEIMTGPTKSSLKDAAAARTKVDALLENIFGPDHSVDIEIGGKLPPGTLGRLNTQYSVDGVKRTLAISNRALAHENLEYVIAHEVGHNIMLDTSLRNSPALSARMQDLYVRWLDFIRRGAPVTESRPFGFSHDNPFLIDGSKSTLEQPGNALLRAGQFQEWAADQLAIALRQGDPLVQDSAVAQETVDLLNTLLRANGQFDPKYHPEVRAGIEERLSATITEQLDMAAVELDIDSGPEAHHRWFKTQVETGGMSESGFAAGFVESAKHIMSPKALRSLSNLAWSPATRRKLQGFIKDSFGADVDDALIRFNLEPEYAAGVLLQARTVGAVTFKANKDSLVSKVWTDFLGALGTRPEHEVLDGLYQEMRSAATALHEANQTVFDINPSLRETALQNIRGKVDTLYEPVAALFDPFWRVTDQRLRRFGNPAINQLADMFTPAPGSEVRGFFEEQTRHMQRFLNQLDQFIDKLSKEEMAQAVLFMQLNQRSANGQVTDNITLNLAQKQFVANTRKMMQSIAEYMQEAGVKMGSQGPEYFPIVFEPDWVMSNREEAISKLIEVYPEALASVMKSVNKERAEALKNAQRRGLEGPEPIQNITEMAESLINGIIEEGGLLDDSAIQQRGPLYSPKFRFGNRRMLDFIFEDPDTARWFSQGFSSDGPHTLIAYTRGATRRAEFSRRLGEHNEKLVELLVRAHEVQPDIPMKEVSKLLDAYFGISGVRTNEKLHQLLGKEAPAGEVINPRLRTAFGYMSAVVYMSILSLATLTSLVDPLGIYVRTGGELDITAKSVISGLKSLVKSNTHAEELANAAGTIGTTLITDLLESRHDTSFMRGLPQKLTAGFFKVTGLQGWTRMSRVMATAASEQFLIKHATNPTEHSQRYLDELGISAQDIQSSTQDNGTKLRLLTPEELSKASPEQIALDDRMGAAMVKLADSMIIRPHAGKVPAWFSDPHFALGRMLKTFTYAFYQTVVSRAIHEAGNGNAVSLLALTSFVPATMVAVALQDMVKGYDPAWRISKYGFTGYTWDAVSRSGVIGPVSFVNDFFTDFEYGNHGVSTLLGPWVQTMGNVVDSVVEDDPRKELKAQLSLLPFGNVIRPHIMYRGDDNG